MKVATIPTFNEAENIEELIDRIMNLKIPDLHILVVDDDSPDGTSSIVRKVMKNNKKVHLLLRKGRRGRGLAGRDGFVKALEMGADTVIEMDADLSHDPKYIPSMLKRLEECDMVLGSRTVKSSIEKSDRPIMRKLITLLANQYIRTVLGVGVRDCNSGFRCFRRDVLEGINVKNLISEGPSIVQEVLYKAHLKGFRICEVPIIFRERKKGKSNLTIKKLVEGYFFVLKLKYMHLRREI